MNGHLYLYLLVVGVVTALTPWAIVAEIVLLGSKAGARAALAFAVGWFCSVAFVAGIVAVGLGGAGADANRQTATGVLIVEVVLGLALVALAVRKRKRTRALPPAASEPGWLRKLDGMRPVVALAFGMFMVNLVFVVDAGLRIAAADPTASGTVVALVFYAVVSTAGLGTVLVAYFSDRAHAEERLAAMRAWISRNNANVIAGVLGLVGAALVARGAIGLIA